VAKARNVTFNLPPELMDKYRAYAKQNYIPSVNAAVKEALEEYALRIEKRVLKDELLKASMDPLFMEDLEESVKAFEIVDTESAKESSKW